MHGYTLQIDRQANRALSSPMQPDPKQTMEDQQLLDGRRQGAKMRLLLIGSPATASILPAIKQGEPAFLLFGIIVSAILWWVLDGSASARVLKK